jgi:hypothetical protein
MARFLRPGWFEVDTYCIQRDGSREPYPIAVQVAHVHLLFLNTATETAIYTASLNIHAQAPYADVLVAMELAPTAGEGRP